VPENDAAFVAILIDSFVVHPVQVVDDTERATLLPRTANADGRLELYQAAERGRWPPFRDAIPPWAFGTPIRWSATGCSGAGRIGNRSRRICFATCAAIHPRWSDCWREKAPLRTTERCEAARWFKRRQE
jgi:hypothetical protein